MSRTQLMKKSVAPSTLKNRHGQWKCYCRFCGKFGLSKLPCSDDQLSIYCTYMSRFLSHSSLLVYLQAVIFVSKLYGIPPPSMNHPSVKLVLEGAKGNTSELVSGAVPVTLSLLKKMYLGINQLEKLHCVFWASCLLMFFSLLRVSHMTESVHNLRVGDVKTHSWGLMLHIRSSKTHRGTRPLLLPVCKLPDKRFCPVYWITKILSTVGNSSGSPLFSAALGRPYTYMVFRSVLNKVSMLAGLGKKFSGHSFRKGGALYLISMGVPLTQVQERGDWKSMCVLRYLSVPIGDRVASESLLASRFV